MKKTFLIILGLIIAIAGVSQNKVFVIKGVVTDSEKNPLAGVNVYTVDRSSYSITNDVGKYEINVSQNDSIIFSMIGFNRVTKIGNILQYNSNIILSDNISLDEVVVMAPPALSSDFSTIKMNQNAIYLNPMADGDALKAITLLPYSTTTDESASPSLRGSSANRSVVLLNGVPVRRPVKYSESNGTGGFSLFSPEIIKEQTVYASNPPVLFGSSSGGAVEIETVDRLNTNSLQLNAQLAALGVFYSSNISKNKLLQVFGNYQFSGPFLKVNHIPTTKDFKTFDGGINYSMDIKENQKIKTYLYGTSEEYNGENSFYGYVGNSGFETKRIFIVNNYVNILKSGILTINNLLDYEMQSFKFSNLDFDNKTRRFYLGTNYKYNQFKNLSIINGITFDYVKDNINGKFPEIHYAMLPESPTVLEKVKDSNKSLESFVYLKWDILPLLSLSGGLRTNIPINGQKYYLNRQISAKYKINAQNSFILGLGKYYNYSLFDQYLFKYYLLESSQYTIDYTFDNGKIQIYASAYLKNEGGSSKILDDFYTENNTNNNLFGLELFYQHALTKNIKYSIGYTYLNNKMDVDSKTYHNSNSYPYIIKASFSYVNKICNISMSYFDHSGDYYTEVIDKKYDHYTEAFQPLYGEYNSTRYGNYRSLSLSLTKSFKIKNNELMSYLTIGNVLNKKNQMKAYYNRDYSQKEFYKHSPITVYLGFCYKFGI